VQEFYEAYIITRRTGFHDIPDIPGNNEEKYMELSDAANDEVQNRLTRTTPPMDADVGKNLLLEAKEIMDRLGVKFFLRQGTCLGAIRDNSFIPWDDDLDLGIIVGHNGFTEQSIDLVLEAFRESGYYVQAQRSDSLVISTLLKNEIRIDLLFLSVIDEQIYHWPGIWFPVSLFKELKEINFLGERFLVPNPPEEYLRIKYGPDWQTPKQFGYAKDVVDNILEEPSLGMLKGLKRFLLGFLNPKNTVRLKILDQNGAPVYKAEVRVVGLGSFHTNRQGYARLYLNNDGYSSSVPSIGIGETYAMVISYGDHEEVLYEEILTPTETYQYRPDNAHPEGRIFVLSQE
jgi:hypothetical protein